MAFVAVAIPVAGAAASGHKPSPSKSFNRRALKQIKALKKKNAAYAAQLAALRTKAEELGLAEHEPTPPTPSGPAGGDLSGTYPAPRIGPSTIFPTNLVDGTLLGADFGVGSMGPAALVDESLGSSEIQNGAIGRSNLAGSPIAGPQLFETHVVTSGRNLIGGNSQGGNAVQCPPGERLLSGGAEWEFESGADTKGLATVASSPDLGDPNQWDVAGRNTSGASQTLLAVALCLKAG